MSLSEVSEEARQRTTYDDLIKLTITENSAHSNTLERNTSGRDNDALSDLPTGPKAHRRGSNITNAPACILRDASHPITSPRPCYLLAMPAEIRIKIYELVVGVDQKVYLEILPSFTIEASTLRALRSEILRDYWVNLTQRNRGDGVTIRQSTTVSFDLQTGQQHIAITHPPPNNTYVLGRCEPSPIYQNDLRLLRTCRQIYHEARSVLYDNNTFVFQSIGALADFFGFTGSDQVHVPRSTDPNKLRAIHAMTRIELCSNVGAEMSPRNILMMSRLIRAGLGCLTSLKSLELSLTVYGNPDLRRAWRIDDSMFSKPSTLRKLIMNVHDTVDTEEKSSIEGIKLEAAEEFVRRILKEEEFSDTLESFWRYEENAASREPLAEGETDEL